MNTNKQQVLDLLRAFIAQRPGLEFANYGSRESYYGEYRKINQQLHDAKILLANVEHSQITGDEIIEASKHAFSGRLTIEEKDGQLRIDYCTGQYFPTEHRAAACAVLSYALWEYHRSDLVDERDSLALHATFRRIFGRSIQQRWFN